MAKTMSKPRTSSCVPDGYEYVSYFFGSSGKQRNPAHVCGRRTITDDQDVYIPVMGDQVMVGPSKALGTVAFIGKTTFSDGQWIGIALAKPEGKNDGSVKGQRYFECDPSHGIFVRANSCIKATTEAPLVSKQDSLASKRRASPSIPAHAGRAAEVQSRLANAVEEVDELQIRQLLPKAYSLGVPHGAIESAQRTLNYRLYESLVRDIDKVRDAVGGLADSAKELEAEFTKVARLSTLLPMDAAKAASTGIGQNGGVSAADSFVAQLKAQVENQIIKGLERQVTTAVQQAVSMATRELVVATAEIQKARAFPVESAKSKVAAHGNGELGTVRQEVCQDAPQGTRLKAQHSLAAAYETGKLNTILQEVNSLASESIKFKAGQSLLESYHKGELNAILDKMTQSKPGSIKLTAKESLVAALQDGQLGPTLQTVVTTEQALAATKIEAVYRGNRARCEMEERKKAAITIQRRMRSRSSAGIRRKSVISRAQAKHIDWFNIFQELAHIEPGSDANLVLGESGFHTALSKVHPQLTPAQILVLWQGHASLAGHDRVDLEAFIDMAEAVAKGGEAAAEWAHMAVETFALLGQADKAAVKIQANFRGKSARMNMRKGAASPG